MSIGSSYNFLIPEEERNVGINNILNSVPNCGSKDFIIMYLATYLSQFYQRDPNYFLSSPEEQFRIFSDDFYTVRDLPDQFVVCKTLCEKYQKFFMNFGIRSEIISLPTKTDVPLFCMLVYGDNDKVFFIDPLSDLQMNQFGFKMDYFGDYSNIHSQAIKENNEKTVQLDRSYITSLENQMGVHFYKNQDLIVKLHNYYRGHSYDGSQCTRRDTDAQRFRSILGKIDLLNSTIINMGQFGTVTGIIERRKLYQMLLNRYSIFSKSEVKGGNGIKFYIDMAGSAFSIKCLIFNSSGQDSMQFKEEYIPDEQKYYLRRIR